MARALHREHHALKKQLLPAGRVDQMIQRLPAQAVGAERQPFARVGADMALRMVLLIDLDHLCDGVHLRPDGLAHLILQRAPLPVGQDLLAKLRHILRMDLEPVLRAGGQRFKLPVHPRRAGLRKDHAAADAGGAVAHDPLVRLDADGHLLQRCLQRLRTLDAAGLSLRLPVAFCDDTRLLDGGIARLVQHFLFEHRDPVGHRQRFDRLDHIHGSFLPRHFCSMLYSDYNAVLRRFILTIVSKRCTKMNNRLREPVWAWYDRFDGKEGQLWNDFSR